jgi:hypothetical protein
MGIDINAAIFVGRLRGELPEELLDGTDTDEAISDEVLIACPPYYDGNSDKGAVVGFELIGTGSQPREVEWDQAKVDDLKRQFKELTGLDAKVYVSPKVW